MYTKPPRKKRLTLGRFYFLNLFAFIGSVILAASTMPHQRIATNFAEWGPHGQAVVMEEPSAMFIFAVVLLYITVPIFIASVVWFIWDCLRNIFGGISQAINPEPPTYVEYTYDTMMQVRRGRKQYAVPWGEVQVGDVVWMNGAWRPLLSKTGLINR